MTNCKLHGIPLVLDTMTERVPILVCPTCRAIKEEHARLLDTWASDPTHPWHDDARRVTGQ